MGADNWDVCPKCLDDAIAEYTVKVAAANERYGKIPAEEWQKELAEALKGGVPSEDNFDCTFREDYGWWIDGGVLKGEFSGGCGKCGLGVNHLIVPVPFYDSPRREES